MNTPRIPDDDFEHDRAAVSAAYAASRAPGAGPPPAVDAAIRAAARRAVGAGPQRAERSWIARWTKPVSVAAIVVLSASVIFVAMEEDASLKPPLAKGPAGARIAEVTADTPREIAAPTAATATGTAKIAVLADQNRGDAASSAAGETRARQIQPSASGDKFANAEPPKAPRRNDVASAAPEERAATAPPTPVPQVKVESPVLASAAPVAPPAYAPAAPPAPAAAPAPTGPSSQALAASAPLPPQAVALSKEKMASRVADARAESEPLRTTIAEAKKERIVTEGSRIAAEPQAKKATALAAAGTVAAPATPVTTPAPLPKAQPALAPQLLRSFTRLRELRDKMQWREFDELVADVEKRWPNVELPVDLAATKRDREKAKASENR